MTFICGEYNIMTAVKWLKEYMLSKRWGKENKNKDFSGGRQHTWMISVIIHYTAKLRDCPV